METAIYETVQLLTSVVAVEFLCLERWSVGPCMSTFLIGFE